jgi:CRISPR/Cas system-associated exonuclease Cas4 (RecB family)
MLQNPLEHHLVPFSKNARNYEVKRQQCLKIVRNSFNLSYSTPQSDNGSIKSEFWVESKDKIIGGKIDEIRSNNTGLDIIDYKTGAIIDEDLLGCKVKIQYQIQMKLYAALYNEHQGVFPDRLIIKGLDGEEYEIPFDKDECIELLFQAKKKFREINQIINEGRGWELLASPSAANCKYCQFRPVCRNYWRTRGDGKEWNLDVWGKIVEVKELRNGIRVLLKNKDKIIAVRGLSVERHNDLLNNSGQLSLILNLAPDTSENFYIESPLTTSFIIED